jgi:hypothetical protein
VRYKFNQNLPYMHLIYDLITLLIIIHFYTFICYLELSFLFAIIVLVSQFVSLINIIIFVLLDHFGNLLILFHILLVSMHFMCHVMAINDLFIQTDTFYINLLLVFIIIFFIDVWFVFHRYSLRIS